MLFSTAENGVFALRKQCFLWEKHCDLPTKKTVSQSENSGISTTIYHHLPPIYHLGNPHKIRLFS